MERSLTLIVLEPKENLTHRFTLLGTPYMGTRLSWLNIPLMLIIGIVASLILAPAEDLTTQILIGLIYGVSILVTFFIHSVGHILSSQIVNAPVKQIIMTMTVNYLDYGEDENHPSRVHIGRALGGPVINLILGMLALLVYATIADSHVIAFFGGMNILVFVTTISPIPSLDGAVLIRELRKWKQ